MFVLVGDPTHIPKAQKLLKQFFKDSNLNHSVNPNRALVYDAGPGCHHSRHHRRDRRARTSSWSILRLLPLGIETAGAVMTVLVHLNITLPAKKGTDHFHSLRWADRGSDPDARGRVCHDQRLQPPRNISRGRHSSDAPWCAGDSRVVRR